MKKLVIILIILIYGKSYSQQDIMPKGVFLFGAQRLDTTEVRESLNVNWLQGVVHDEAGGATWLLNNSSNFNMLGIVLKNSYYLSAAQRLEYNHSKSMDPKCYHYFKKNEVGFPSDLYWKCDTTYTAGYMVSDPYPSKEYDYKKQSYYVEMRLKIDKTPVHNSDTNVVRLEIFCQQHSDNVLLKDTLIKFKDFPDQDDKTITIEFQINHNQLPIKKDFSIPPLGTLLGRSEENNVSARSEEEFSGINIKVYWYGIVTTYLRKVSVMDSVGKNLFSRNYDNAITSNFQNLITIQNHKLKRIRIDS